MLKAVGPKGPEVLQSIPKVLKVPLTGGIELNIQRPAAATSSSYPGATGAMHRFLKHV